MMETSKTISLETGCVWICPGCHVRQEPIDGEEWPVHCGTTMQMRGTYQFVEVVAVPS